MRGGPMGGNSVGEGKACTYGVRGRLRKEESTTRKELRTCEGERLPRSGLVQFLILRVPVNPDTHSGAFRTPIPEHSGHPFRSIPDRSERSDAEPSFFYQGCSSWSSPSERRPSLSGPSTCLRTAQAKPCAGKPISSHGARGVPSLTVAQNPPRSRSRLGSLSQKMS